MNDTLQFLKRLMGIRLSANERLAMRERLAAYTDMHPVTTEAFTPSPYLSFFGAISSRRFSTYALVALLFVVSGSGITLAAEGSAPGDSLYSIKINVNEPVMTTLAATPKAQAEVAAQIASRRVDEAVVLAHRGTLTPERQDYLTHEFTSRVAIATKKADLLAEQGDTVGAENAKADLAVQLAGEAQALGAVTSKDNEQDNHLLVAVVETSQQISGSSDDDGGPAIAATLATASTMMAASDTQATATMAKHSFAKMTASTTPRVKATIRIPRSLYLNASTTLRALAPALESSGILTPKTDHAIPVQSTDSQATLNVSIPND